MISRSQLTSRTAATLMAGAMLFGASAFADSTAALTDVEADLSGSTLEVDGKVAFTDSVTIAEDAGNDGRPGAELVGASIGFDDLRDIAFTVELGGALPTGTIPVGTSIEWEIDVAGKGRATTLTAINSSLSGLEVPTPGEYSFEFWDCTDDNLGCIVTPISGSSDGNLVTFLVPRSTLGVSASGGEKIFSPRIAVQPILATPAVSGKPAGADLDSMSGETYTVPTTTVDVTVAGVTVSDVPSQSGRFDATFSDVMAGGTATVEALVGGVAAATETVDY